jgi:hypothetical protein
MEHCAYQDSIYAVTPKTLCGDVSDSSSDPEELIQVERSEAYKESRHRDHIGITCDYGEKVFRGNYGMEELDSLFSIRRLLC